jgi:hypothetical protein
VERNSLDETIDALASEIDGTLLDERLRMTPTERLEAMMRVVRFVSAVKRPSASRPPTTD